MLKLLLILDIVLAAYLIGERSVVKYDAAKEQERQRVRELIYKERVKLQDEVNQLRK
jgi:hypothetical protein